MLGVSIHNMVIRSFHAATESRSCHPKMFTFYKEVNVHVSEHTVRNENANFNMRIEFPDLNRYDEASRAGPKYRRGFKIKHKKIRDFGRYLSLHENPTSDGLGWTKILCPFNTNSFISRLGTPPPPPPAKLVATTSPVKPEVSRTFRRLHSYLYCTYTKWYKMEFDITRNTF